MPEDEDTTTILPIDVAPPEECSHSFITVCDGNNNYNCVLSINQEGEARDGNGNILNDEELGRLFREWAVLNYSIALNKE